MALPVLALDGRVVGEIDLQYSADGVARARFRVKCDKRKLNEATGKWEPVKKLWMTVTCYRQLAENVAESLRAGDQVNVLGELETAEWTDEHGAHSALRYVASSVGPSLLFAPRRHSVKVREGTASVPSPAPTDTGTPANDDPWA